ncbi:MAG: DUF4381 domain-containing protein [Cocleimonas sp.]
MADSPTPMPTPPATAATPDGLVLKDIHLAGSPDFWPPAIGWWILLSIILLALSALFLSVRSKLRQQAKLKKQREKLMAKLKMYEDKLTQNPSNKTIADMNTLLRQLAVNYYPRSKISSLTGCDWLKFLDQSGNTRGFTKGAGRILIEAPYQSGDPENLNLDEFISLIRKWVHRLVDQPKAEVPSVGGKL